MNLEIPDAELFGVTESSATLSFSVHDAAGVVDAAATVQLNGRIHEVGAASAGTRLIRLEGLAAATEYRVTIRSEGGAVATPSPYLPASFTTHPAADAPQCGSFATLNDLHFGEPHVGGVPRPDGNFDREAPGYAVVRSEDAAAPYWQFMNADAIDDINRSGVDLSVIKGDIADMGRPEQFEDAAKAFAELSAPHHVFLGNHDHYARLEQRIVDGYALLRQPPAPRSFSLGGWRLVLIDTVEPGEHHGVFPPDRLAWLRDTLEDTRSARQPTLVFMHHQPVPPEFRDRYPNRIGLRPEDSLELIALLGQHPQVKGVLIGHTHRNRVRHYANAGALPFIEVHCTKDYPGGWARYRIFEDGSFRQEARRTSSVRALEHSTRCRDLFAGGYRNFALGSLTERSFVVPRQG